MAEDFGRPVIAALSSPALGGGAALALAAPYRLSTPGGTIGFPEVTLGLVPGSGASQRLPRLVGADIALRLLLSGRMIDRPAAVAATDAGLDFARSGPGRATPA